MRSRLTTIFPGGALLLMTILAATPVLAETVGDEAWRFEITPYLFAAGLEGTVGARGVTSEVDVSFTDLFNKLDAGFLGLFEARKGRWTFALDAIYLKLGDDGIRSWQGPLGNGNSAALDVSVTQQIYQPFVGYRVLDERTKMDLIVGARYTQLDVEATLSISTGLPLLPDGSRSVSRSVSWWDPIIGVRVLAPISDQWSFVGYADVGGGGDTDITYQLVAGVNWQFAKQYSAKFGYRYLAQDYEKDGFVWDTKTSGPYLGLGVIF